MVKIVNWPLRVKTPSYIRWFLAVLSLLIVWSTSIAFQEHFNYWDRLLGSSQWKWVANHHQEKRVVVVDIDEKSIKKIGSWPWSRAQIAYLINRIESSSPSVLAVDILFDGKHFDDGQLKQSLIQSNSPVILSQVFSLKKESELSASENAGQLYTDYCPNDFVNNYGVISPNSDFLNPRVSLGHINPIIDSDGAVRMVPGVICDKGRGYPSLAMATIAALNGNILKLVKGSGLTDPSWWLESGDFKQGLDEKGRYLVSYTKDRESLVSLSASDLLDNKINPDLIKGSLVLLGSTALGANDSVPTPQGPAVGGIEVHAQTLISLLDNKNVYVPHLFKLANPLLALVLVLAMVALSRRFKILFAFQIALISLSLIVFVFGLHLFFIYKFSWWLPQVLPIISIGLTGFLLTSFELLFVRQDREKLFIKLSSYLPETVAKEVSESDLTEQFQAKSCTATIMTVHLRNFSRYCERRPVEESAIILQLFYSATERVVNAYGGVIEMIEGERLVISWNATVGCEKHVVQAIDCSKHLYDQLITQLPITNDVVSTPPLDISIGIETGNIIVGSFGSTKRKSHTVLGATVFISNSLAIMAPELLTPILVGSSAYENYIHQEDLIAKGEFLLEGISKPRNLFSVQVDYNPNGLRLIYENTEEQVIA